MERRRTVAIILGVVILVWGVGLTLYFSGGVGPARVTQGATSQRFTAKEGTTRENAMALVSSNREEGIDAYERKQRDTPESAAENPSGTPTAKSLSKSQEEFKRDMAESVLEKIAEADTPEAREEALKHALGEARDDDVAAHLHMELGKLYAESGAEGLEAALEEYGMALEMAQEPATRLDAALRSAEARVEINDMQSALMVLDKALSEAPPLAGGAVTAEALSAWVLLGDLGRDSGDAATAERAYSEAIDTGLRADAGNPEAGEWIRLAGMRLARLLRSQGRHDEAERIGRRVRSRFMTPGATAGG